MCILQMRSVTGIEICSIRGLKKEKEEKDKHGGMDNQHPGKQKTKQQHAMGSKDNKWLAGR